MTDRTTADIFLAKAEESLAGAESEYANGRHNNCANRAYYACFQAAIAALLQAGIRPSGQRDQWPHAFVLGQFAGQLVNRRHLYPPELRNVLTELQLLRHGADYAPDTVTQTEASRALRRARAFVQPIRQRAGSTP